MSPLIHTSAISFIHDMYMHVGAGENKAVGGGGAAKGIADRAAKDADEETYEQVQQSKYNIWECMLSAIHIVYVFCSRLYFCIRL